MNDQSPNDIFHASSFMQGHNAEYLEQLYARYADNPGAVDESWQQFFRQLDDEHGDVTAEAAGPSGGMQTGGLVSDRLAAASSSEGEGGTEGGMVLPVLVAQDSEMDQLTAGGTNAFLNFMRENAGDINTLLDRS